MLAAWLGAEIVALFVGPGATRASRWLIAGALSAGTFLLVARLLAPFGWTLSAGLELLSGVLLAPIALMLASFVGLTGRRRRA